MNPHPQLPTAVPTPLADRLAGGAVVLTVLLSAGGLLVPGLYRDRDAFVRLTQADDVFRLVVVSPILAAGVVMAARGSVPGRLLVMGALGTLAYLYGFLSFGAALSGATLGQIAILGLVAWSLLLAAGVVDRESVDLAVGRWLPRRATAVLLLAMGLLSTLQWAGARLGSGVRGPARWRLRDRDGRGRDHVRGPSLPRARSGRARRGLARRLAAAIVADMKRLTSSRPRCPDRRDSGATALSNGTSGPS